ncbi:LbtU family siderophore porin [Candidatus Venteria ishoeyi]|uniref:LbtU family siderophore porin n=1 Tax=Candidatus Venteria ishoeyi TaxID=1899563 RepID=UPI0025A563E0|nr:LbtU family siderophore porin [Candidatus Venteria ishoeyi]MDM8545996.1 LbtU family siderophore porin [Candidatus Venteria ishoeyi]
MIILILLATLSGTGLVQADMGMAKQMQDMEQRLQYLERQLQSQDTLIQRKQDQIIALEKLLAAPPVVANATTEPNEATNDWHKAITISGLVEVEATRTSNADINDTNNNNAASDLVLATVELGLNAQITDWVNANIVLLYEEDQTGLDVDAATITLGKLEHNPFYFTAGRTALPFGRFETHMVSDPFTLEIGETFETVALAGFEYQGFYASAYVFNGDIKTLAETQSGTKRIDNAGFNLGYAWETKIQGLDIGLSYLNDLAESDSISEHLNGHNTQDEIAAYGLHATYRHGPFNIIGEYLAAADRFALAELDFKSTGAQPKAWNLEAAYELPLMSKDHTLAIAYQVTEEALALALPEKRLLLGWSLLMLENTRLNLEFAYEQAYEVADGGSGQDAKSLAVQLAVEF